MSEGALDVVVVGNVGVDTNVYSSASSIDFGRESHFTENLDCVGQAGGYTARGFAQLGKRTAFIGHVGDDHIGYFVRETLDANGIDLSALFEDPQGTARSINFMYADGRRVNFYDGKGHMDLQPDLKACRRVLERAKLVHFNIPNWARTLLPVAKELELTISVDLQDVITMPDGYRDDFVDYADIVFFSAAHHPDPAELIETLLAREQVHVVVAGMGAEGCALGTRQRGIERFGAFTGDQPVIDANGAGDSLAVGFLASYVLDGYPLTDAITRGQLAARHCCSQRASSGSLITAERLDQLFAESRAV